MIYGSPGQCLDGRFPAKAGALTVGRSGELATAAVLTSFEAAHPEVAILHSLRLPARKMRTDIDHVVVAGRRVWIIDSKCWAPGFYWSWLGLAWRGLRPAPHARRRTMAATARVLQGYLGTSAVVQTPVVVVWPSSEARRLSVWAWRPLDAKPLTGRRFAAVVNLIVPPAPADPKVVASLRELLIA